MKAIPTAFGSASGKILLSGEHSVVHYQPALVASIDLQLQVRLTSAETTFVNSKHMDSKDLISCALQQLGIDEPVRVDIESQIPMCGGFGTSAALATATVRAGLHYQGGSLPLEKIFEMVMECEKIAHGNPSGVDPAAVVYGGLIEFHKETGITPLKLDQQFRFVALQTGTAKESTKEMVEFVQQRIDTNPGRNNQLLATIGKLTQACMVALRSGNSVELAEILDENGKRLEELGVVSLSTIELSNRLRSQGFSVKVSGAGGISKGSGVLLVYHPDPEELSKLDKVQAPRYSFSIGE